MCLFWPLDMRRRNCRSDGGACPSPSPSCRHTLPTKSIENYFLPARKLSSCSDTHLHCQCRCRFQCPRNSRVFIQSWRWDPPKLSREIPSFPLQTPILLGFLGTHSWLWFFCRETKSFGYIPEVPVTKIRVSAPAPYKNPTVKASDGKEAHQLKQFSPQFQALKRLIIFEHVCFSESHLTLGKQIKLILVAQLNCHVN